MKGSSAVEILLRDLFQHLLCNLQQVFWMLYLTHDTCEDTKARQVVSLMNTSWLCAIGLAPRYDLRENQPYQDYSSDVCTINLGTLLPTGASYCAGEPCPPGSYGSVGNSADRLSHPWISLMIVFPFLQTLQLSRCCSINLVASCFSKSKITVQLSIY